MRDELLQLLLTSIGERAFLPELSARTLRRLVFENTDTGTLGVTQSIVSSALSTWLGTRLTVQSLTVTTDSGAIDVVVQYQPIGSAASKVMKLQRPAGG